MILLRQKISYPAYELKYSTSSRKHQKVTFASVFWAYYLYSLFILGFSSARPPDRFAPLPFFALTLFLVSITYFPFCGQVFTSEVCHCSVIDVIAIYKLLHSILFQRQNMILVSTLFLHIYKLNISFYKFQCASIAQASNVIKNQYFFLSRKQAHKIFTRVIHKNTTIKIPFFKASSAITAYIVKKIIDFVFLERTILSIQIPFFPLQC